MQSLENYFRKIKQAKEIEKKHDQELKQHPFKKIENSALRINTMMEETFLSDEPIEKHKALEHSAEFDKITKGMLDEFSKKLTAEKDPDKKQELLQRKEEFEFNINGTKSCRAKQNEHYAHIALLCDFPVQYTKGNLKEESIESLFDVEEQSKELRNLRERVYQDRLFSVSSELESEEEDIKRKIKEIDQDIFSIQEELKRISDTMGSMASYRKLSQKKTRLDEKKKRAREQSKINYNSS